MRIAPAALLLLVLTPSPIALAQMPPADQQVRSFAMPPLEELQATRERPLFSPKRRPDDVPAPPETPVVEESPETVPFDLTGIVMGGEISIAILRNRDTQETVQMRQGEMLADWSIEEIGPRHVVLRQEDRQVRLELFVAKTDGSENAPVPAFIPPVTRRPPPASQASEEQRRASPLSPSQRRMQRRGQQQRGLPQRRMQNP